MTRKSVSVSLAGDSGAEIARLRTMLVIDGAGDKSVATDIGKAAGGQG